MTTQTKLNLQTVNNPITYQLKKGDYIRVNHLPKSGKPQVFWLEVQKTELQTITARIIARQRSTGVNLGEIVQVEPHHIADIIHH